MSDPLPLLDPITNSEIFRKTNVEEYHTNPAAFSKFPQFHYSQLDTNFSGLGQLLKKLKIPASGITTTVIGGYTGEFASSLRDLGMNVIFTDPLDEWVEKARANGFESYQCRADEISRQLLGKTDLFATFECYYPFFGTSSLYDLLRLIQPKYGLIFAASFNTVNALIEDENEPKSMRGAYYFLKDHYNGKRRWCKDTSLIITSFQSADRYLLEYDCRIMKACVDNFGQRGELTIKEVTELSKKMREEKSKILASLSRTVGIYRKGVNNIVPQEFRHLYANDFRIQGRSFDVKLT
jgi:hypothetical protein